jgi:hypothetical protein
VQAVAAMVHFRLDPEKFLSLDDAWKQACSRLGSYDEKAGRADEALARRGRALIGRSVDLGRRDRDLRKRIADETITDDERATAKAELAKLAAVDTELAATESVLNKKLAVRTDKYAVEERRIERLMRDALADGLLDTWIEGPDGQPKCLLEREPWRQAAFGAANIASIPDLEDPSFNPGPDTEGKPAFVEKSVFENWLDAQQPGASGGPQPEESPPQSTEPVAVAGAAESPVALPEPNRGGRPTDRERIVAEARRRLDAKENVPRKLVQFAGDLRKWLEKQPDPELSNGQVMAVDTIEGHVRAMFNEFWSGQKG